MVADDERLNPLITLLQAVEEPHVDHFQDVEQALSKLQDVNTSELSRKAESSEPALFRLEPFHEMIEAGHKVQDDVQHLVRSLEHRDSPEFLNWGRTVQYTPSHTLVVRTIRGVCEVVKWAANKGKRVRVSAFRHTWSDLYGADGDVIIMFLPVESLTKLPYKQPPKDWTTELAGIQLVPTIAGRAPPPRKAFCKIMAGTTNDQFRQWCFDNKTWCMPFNVIMLEVTFGGTNGPICHGSGFGSSTLSDLVVEVCYVDVHGGLQIVNDAEELRAASGCFGLLGVVISVTLQLDQMGVAELMPVHKPLPLAIPPPKDYQLPPQVEQMMKKEKITEKQLEEARLDFVRRCKEDYYLEWFWFPYQETCWVNTWKRRDMTPQDAHLQAYPGNNWLTGVKSQELQETVAQEITSFFLWKDLPGYMQAWLFGLATMAVLPNITDPKNAIETYVSEALHFRRGIQNFRCWDSEWEIPIPSQNGERHYETIQRAWWDGISAMYARIHDAPARVALEMRLTGQSSVLLAPQRGNASGTVSIEVLTTLASPQSEWASFCQEVTDRWTSYDTKGEDGRTMNPRPHWAKQWSGLLVRGKPIEQYIREDAYGDAFAEFRGAFQNIVQKRGGTVNETLARFGNQTLQGLIFH
ncbi:uncharacterized protein LAESUDRAFT_739389 [Laetiporus sulphureus 93-53]|uniref:FAD-binding PCMH-type domain-containing protein n=1 Tax=Laetiporus sulphureus 93-53 TaxID=1314785 RepID=A0A165BFB2_9APHY|nr:uncharacterized protein LAESUDRAFT_739389 [Laetiporus sulphureus 93-53]KZT00933.1 hypothetical protein LAESUDRAFT_739389 [Laetiporus sulphureus 93-53]